MSRSVGPFDMADSSPVDVGSEPYGGHPPYVQESETSRAAADSVAGTAASIRLQVYQFIRECSLGVTDDQIEEALSLRHQTASARRRELVLKGWIRDSGRKRVTRSGRTATVWEAI